MSKIDPELKKKLLKESQTPFKGLRRILWIAFCGSSFLGLLIMLSKIASGGELQQNNLFIQLGLVYYSQPYYSLIGIRVDKLNILLLC